MHCHSLRVLRLARAMTYMSQGLFNCTVGGALVEKNCLPRHSKRRFIAAGRACDIQIAAGRARLRRPVLITLDGIAKGYAVDLAVAQLKRMGVSAGIVNAGGDLRVFGGESLPVMQRTASGSWKPLAPVCDVALASSRTGLNVGHEFPACILSARDTRQSKHAPRRDDIVTVQAPRAWRADALTKVACLVPEPHRHHYLRLLGGRLVSTPQGA